MTNETVEKQNNGFRKVLKGIWDWFLKSEEKLRAEENEIYEMRLDQLRAEEDAIEKYGSAKFSYNNEELEPDIRLFQIIDLIGEWFRKLRQSFWIWLTKVSKTSPFWDRIRKRLNKRAKERAKQKARKMAELAVSGVDDAGESIFHHLPKSWQEAYLELEDETVGWLEEKEGIVRSFFQKYKNKYEKKRLECHDKTVLVTEQLNELWNERRHVCIAGMGIIGLLIVGILLIASLNTRYIYSYKGKTLGVVENKRTVLQVLDIVEEKMKAVYGSEITIDPDEDFSFVPTKEKNIELDSEDDILANLSYLHDINVYAYGIIIDGTTACVLETEAEADAVLNAVRNSYTKDEIEYSEIGFKEEVTVERIATPMTSIISYTEAFSILTESVASSKIHTVEAGETFAEIAELAGLTTLQLHALNPTIDQDQLKVGQELALEAAHSPVTVYTIATETYMEEVPFETEYTDSDSMYQGESTLKTSGKVGTRYVTATIRRENGSWVSQTLVSSETITEPVTQEVIRGTKEVPTREGTGTFIWPTTGTISSKFGMRWGRLHAGIDIAKSNGIPIYAADGGTVTTAGWETSYGYVVRISHGNGIVTTYAHCSKLLVKVGEKVYQGQKIALMGSTGNSTGPHLHFEIRINNVAKDPLNYLP